MRDAQSSLHIISYGSFALVHFVELSHVDGKAALVNENIIF